MLRALFYRSAILSPLMSKNINCDQAFPAGIEVRLSRIGPEAAVLESLLLNHGPQ
jgi:hypothetical protein